MLPKKLKRLSDMQLIALGFLLLILGGTCLLMLPCSSRTGEFTPFITALFTATSATCVTGLILVDTYTQLSKEGPVCIGIDQNKTGDAGGTCCCKKCCDKRGKFAGAGRAGKHQKTCSA